MKIENLASCIRNLREIAKEKPNAIIDSAILYLDIFLEKLCTKEIVVEEFPTGTLRMDIIIPAYEFEIGMENFYSEKIKASFEYKMDEILANYEQVYGLEPVTVEDALPYLNTPNYVEIQPSDEQMQMYGYKIYKKKVR